MSEPKRQHPAASLAHAADYIREHYITIIIFIFIGLGKNSLLSLIFFFGPFIFVLITGVVKWYWFTYQIVDNELHVKQGVINKNNIYIPANRIQAIDISRGVVQRALGLVALEVKTAGESSKQAKISAITRDEAEQMRSVLRESASDEIIEDTGVSKEDIPTFQLSTKNLLIAASTSDKLGLILALFAVIYRIASQAFNYNKLFNVVQNTWHHYATASAILILAIGLLMLAWLISFGYTVFLNYDFSITVKDDELMISRGLLKNVNLTIPLDRIQAIQIKEGIFRQPFGYATLKLEDAGYSTTTLFPLIAKGDIPDFLNEVLPEYHFNDKPVQTPIPISGLRRYIFRKLWKILPVIILCWIFIPYGIYSWLLLIPAFFFGWLQYHDAGVRVENNSIILSSRVLSKRTGIVKKYRMQSVDIHQNPFQSRLNLGDFSLYVASGSNKRTFRVRELPDQISLKYWQWLSHEKDENSSIAEDTEVR